MNKEACRGLNDVYYQPSDNRVWLMGSGMEEYSGDNKEARYVAQIEN